MAWTEVQRATAASTGSAASLSATFGSAVTSGNLIVAKFGVQLASGTLASVGTVADTLNTYASAASIVHGTTPSLGVGASIATVGSSGTTPTVTFTPSASGLLALEICEYSNAGGYAVDASSTGHSGSIGTALSSGSMTTTAASDLVIGLGVAQTSGQTWTAGSGFSTDYSLTGSGTQLAFFSEEKLNVAAGSIAATMTASVSTPWICIGAAISSGAVLPSITAAPGVFSLTGESAVVTHQRVISANPGAIAETGEPASLRWGHVDHASAGTFSLTGESIPFDNGADLVASPGVFVETGKAATFLRAHVLHANPGTFIETGKAATLGADNTLAATHGVFQLIPTTAGLAAQHEIFAATGSFSLTGKGALLYPGVTLFANPGVFTEGRIPAGLTASRELFAAPGVFVETGQSIVMDAGLELIAAPGVFHVSGGPVALQTAHTLTAVEPATFVVTGKSANLVVSTPIGPPGPTAYHVYSNTGVGDPINYDSPVATVTGLTWSTQPLEGPATWSFGVRAFDPLDGLEEQNLDCSVTVVLDGGSLDISNAPLPPIGISAQPNEGASIRVVWSYPSLNAASAPTGFHVYVGTGGVPNYSIPAATVIAGTGLLTRYQAVVTGGQNGVAYTIGVRAFNAIAEEQNTYTVTEVAVSVGPRAVVGLTAVATSQG